MDSAPMMPVEACDRRIERERKACESGKAFLQQALDKANGRVGMLATGLLTLSGGVLVGKWFHVL